MRGLEKLMLAGFVGLVVLGVWSMRDWLAQHVPVSVMASFSPPPSTPKPVAASVPVTPNKLKSGKRANRVPTEEAAALNGVATSVIEVPYSGPPFPEPNDFPNGITGSQIRADFGEPTARVMVSIGGQFVEKYYYLNKEHTRYTIASLQDGRVVLAESRPL